MNPAFLFKMRSRSVFVAGVWGSGITSRHGDVVLVSVRSAGAPQAFRDTSSCKVLPPFPFPHPSMVPTIMAILMTVKGFVSSYQS